MVDLAPQAEGLVAWFASYGLLLLVVLALALVVLRLGRGFIHRFLRRSLVRTALQAGIPQELAEAEAAKRAITLEGLLVSILRLAVLATVALVVLAVFDLLPVVAALGLVGAAVAFAGQDIIRDYLNGMLIVLENQFATGDVVRIGGVSGTVEQVGLRRTELRDLSGTVHIVANGEIRVASNLTRVHAAVNLDVSVAYGTDVDRAMAVIDAVGAGMAAEEAWAGRILEPPAALRVDALGDSGVDIKVVGRVRAGDQWAATGELRRRILIAFARDEIEIPFPHRVVISRSEGAAAAPSADGLPANDEPVD